MIEYTLEAVREEVLDAIRNDTHRSVIVTPEGDIALIGDDAKDVWVLTIRPASLSVSA